ARLELIAAGVLRRRAGKVAERILFDDVNEAARLARRRDEVVPATGREMTALSRHAGHVDGDRIEAAEVVQQPAVETVGLQGCLNVSNIEPGRCRWGHPVQYSRLRAPYSDALRRPRPGSRGGYSDARRRAKAAFAHAFGCASARKAMGRALFGRASAVPSG